MVATLRVEFHFDFGSPNAHLAELVLPQIEQRTGVKFDYIPVLLGGVSRCCSTGWSTCSSRIRKRSR